MSKLLRRLVPIAAALAWRNRSQIASWYRNRNQSDATTTKKQADTDNPQHVSTQDPVDPMTV